MDKIKSIKLFIKLFLKDMFDYIKEPFNILGYIFECLLNTITYLLLFIINFMYAVLLFIIYPFRTIQLCFMAIKNYKKWNTEENYNKYYKKENNE